MYITQPLHRNVQQFPESVASICGGRVYTYAETVGRVSRLAGALRARGIRSGDRVAVFALNSDRYYQLLLAAAWADAVMVPINVRWSSAEVAYSLNEVGARVIFVDDAFAPMMAQLHELCPQLETVIHCADEPTPADMLSFETLIAETPPVADAHRRRDALAAVLYTGGTTGFPKGVMLSHRNLFTAAMGTAAASPVTTRGTILHVAPMFHLAGLGCLLPLSAPGCTHVFIPTFDPLGVLSAIGEHHVTDAVLVPTMIQMLVDHPRLAEFDHSSLRGVVYGASPISESLLTRARAAFPVAKFQQAYGMTELSPVATVLSDEDHDDPVRRRSAGRAAPHSLVKIVDPDGNEVPRGTVGEIIACGDHVMLGYWDKPEETAAALRDGWMHTGDGGYMDDDGYVFIADRIKDMIISGGENVYSVEVENILARHPSVAQCAVIAVPDQRWGERVHAVVSVIPATTLNLGELQEHCRNYIAGYKIPRSLDIVEEFPMSGAGKILKNVLRSQYQ
jgi:acyl-CoA synthetase (AMP-forming)/AMP-acid ligase II